MSKNAIIEKTLLRGLANIVWDPSITKTKFSYRFSPNFWRLKKPKLVLTGRGKIFILINTNVMKQIRQCLSIYYNASLALNLRLSLEICHRFAQCRLIVSGGFQDKIPQKRGNWERDLKSTPLCIREKR